MSIPKEYLENICKLGSGENCCAYLILSADGFECAKNSPIKYTIDLRLAEGTMNAKGDNCDGYKEEKDDD